MTCDFAYVEPVGKVNGASFDLSSKRLTVTGIDLPTMVRPKATDLTGTYGVAA